jgi:hypothetical protein
MFVNKVRSGVNSVEDIDHVSIEKDNIDNVCDKLSNMETDVPKWDAPVFPDSDSEDFVDFLALGNSINFCFNDPVSGKKYETEYNGVNWSGSFGMWASLYREYTKNKNILSSDWMKNLTLEEFEDITEPVDVSMPINQLRVWNINNLGKFLESLEYKSFKSLFEDNDSLFSGGLVDILSNTKAFKDTRYYRDNMLRFDKRNQLFCTMVYDRFYYHNGEEWANFDDIDKLTIFSDYGIPAYLNSKNVLNYSDTLQNYINNCKILPEGCEEEVEIRVATVLSGDIIYERLNNEYGMDIGYPELDYCLWKLRKEASTKEHITLTDSY